MSDSQRSWTSVKGWLDGKSSQLTRRLVPRRSSNRASSNLGSKNIDRPSVESPQSRESPPSQRDQPPGASRNEQRRISTSGKTYATGYSESRNSEDQSRYYRDEAPPSASTLISREGYPLPRPSKRYSGQQSYSRTSASIPSDDVDHRVSRRRSNTSELPDRKVPSIRQEPRGSILYPEDVRTRTRGGVEPTHMQDPAELKPASRGRPMSAISVGLSTSDKRTSTVIKPAADSDVDNRLGPPRSSMSRRSSLLPESISRNMRLIKRRSSHAIDPDEIASHMRQLKISDEMAKTQPSRDRSRSRGRNERPRPQSRREEEEAALREDRTRGRSMSRGHRLSKSRSVERRRPREDREPERHAERRPSMTMHSRPRIDTAIESEADSNVGIVGRNQPLTRTPSGASVQSRRLSRASSRGSRTRESPTEIHDSRARRSSNASDHASHSIPIHPPSSSSRSAVEYRPIISNSYSARPSIDEQGRYMAEHHGRQRRNSTASIISTDPNMTKKRGILRKTGRSLTFTDGIPPIVPPEPSMRELTRKDREPSRSRSRGRAPSDDELRHNTIHNARNLKYQPDRDGYGSTSPSGRRRPGLVPVRYPSDDQGYRPARRYTSPTIGSVPYAAMQSYPVQYQGSGGGNWYPTWEGNPSSSPTRDYYDPYGYSAHPSSVPSSHLQYPSWPQDVRGSYSSRSQKGSGYMRSNGRNG